MKFSNSKDKDSSNMKKFEDKNFRGKVLFVFGLVMMVFSSCISVFAASFLYNSNEVSFNNSSSPSISSNNVQGAIDELYSAASDYSALQTRVAALEARWKNSPTSYFNGNDLVLKQGSSGGNIALSIRDSSNAERGAVYYQASGDQVRLMSKTAGGSNGSGKLDLSGNPVTVNGTSLNGIKAPLEVYRFRNASTFTIPLSASPSSSHFGSYLMFNENGSGTQHFVSLIKCGSNPVITNLINTTYTFNISATTNACTITSTNSTVWGEIVIIGIYL